MNIQQLLFATQAVKVAPAGEMFWYTSGFVGPMYIMTHYVFGGEAKALELLAFIDAKAEERKAFPILILDRLQKQYEEDARYAFVIDQLVLATKKIIAEEEVSYISGGQRRDWFFAPLVAKMVGLPNLYIYNDMSVIDEAGEAVSDIHGAKVLNIADLLMVASSFTDKWIPAIAAIHGKLTVALSVVDRCQGGKEKLAEQGVRADCICAIDEKFFNALFAAKEIDSETHALFLEYLQDDYQSVRNWLIKNPGFLESALRSSDAKTAARAKKLVDEDLYKISQREGMKKPLAAGN